jgi:iron(III) transport system ATP-binding protein
VTNLAVTDLHKGFGSQPVLTGVDLEVPAGSLTAILGPSGSGKTTLLRVVVGFERVDRGEVRIGGKVVDDGDRYVSPEDRSIGYVPQEGALFPHLTVGRNVAFGLAKSVRRSGVVGDLLELVGLRGWGSRYPHQLSGGQQQRVALARALAINPSLVLLDEPFSSLDASLRANVRADVQAVLRRSGTTALLVTHDQDEALSWADHVAVISEGRIGQFDTPHALYSHPKDAGVARFLGEANLMPGTVGADGVRTELGVLVLETWSTVPASGRVTVMVRPEQLELSTEADGAPLAGVVREYQYFGHDAVVKVQPDAGPADARLVVRINGGTPFVPGTRVGVRARGPVLAWGPADPLPEPA